MNHWHRRDRAPNWSHALIKLIFHFVRTDDGPIGSVIEHLSVGLFGTRCGLNEKKAVIKKLYLIRFGCKYVTILQKLENQMGFNFKKIHSFTILAACIILCKSALEWYVFKRQIVV